MKKIIFLIPLILLLALYNKRPVTVTPYCGPFIPNATIVITSGTNLTISGDSINSNGTNTACMTISNVNGLHITKCKLMNTNTYAIRLYKCKNVVVDSCFISNIGAGIIVQQCSNGVGVNANRILNVNGNSSDPTFGHAIQTDSCMGGNIHVINNHIWNVLGQAVNPHDQISIYKTYGLAGDSVMVTGNEINGGQTFLTGTNGAAGIVLGDVGGAYQVARNNKVVNTGVVGIQAQGGTHIKIDHNQVYMARTAVSKIGLAFGNYSKEPTSDVYIGYNTSKCITSTGSEFDLWFDPAVKTYAAFQPAGWTTNITNASITAAILPSVMWSSCVIPVLPPVIGYSPSILALIYGTAIDTLKPTHTGGNPVSYSGTLPAGLHLNAVTGVISGTPTAATASATYHIVGTNVSGSSMANISITVNKYPLIIYANSKTKLFGTANPTLSVSYSQWQLTDGPSSITQPTITTTAVTNSPIGFYTITAFAASSANYAISYVDGVLTVDQGSVILRHFTTATH